METEKQVYLLNQWGEIQKDCYMRSSLTQLSQQYLKIETLMWSASEAFTDNTQAVRERKRSISCPSMRRTARACSICQARGSLLFIDYPDLQH